MYSSGMKRLRLACVWAAVMPLVARAQLTGGSGDDQQQQPPPVEIPDFSGLNEYIYQPRTTVTFGARIISGVKTSFSGRANIAAPETLPNPNVPVSSTTGQATYHDGYIGVDTRTVTINNGDGTTSTVPVSPDGRTNTWSYAQQSQLTSDNLLNLSIYSAAVPQFDANSRRGGYSAGMELAVSHDMRNLGKKLSWKIFGGMSLNDISSFATGGVASNITAVTDTYDLFGQTPPPAPYSSPGSSTNNVYDSSGNQVLTSTGTAATQSVTTTTLIGNQALNRSVTTSSDRTSVVDTWKLHGAYLLFRGGPELDYNFTDHLHLSVSAGPALIFAGSTYDVVEAFTAPTGVSSVTSTGTSAGTQGNNPIVNTIPNTTSKLVLAYYADATLEYTLTDTTGFYLGAVYQNGGSYTQTAAQVASSNPAGSTASYTTKVDFSNQDGVRTGVSFKF